MEDDLYNMHDLLKKTKSMGPIRIVVAAPYDRASLESLHIAQRDSIVDPILVGDERRIRVIAEGFKIPLKGCTIIHAEEDFLQKSASLIAEGKGDCIMKGMVGTGEFIHVFLEPRWRIRTQRILSHVGMFEIPQTKRIFLMSDGGINIMPNFTRKIQIVANAVDVARKLGINKVRVAMLAAVEKVRLPAMPATLDAFLMKKFSETGYFGECEIDGPFAFDNAIDPEKAGAKGMRGGVAGKANVIVVPNIETGNVIWKSITCLEKREAAGVVVGGSCPIVVPSRSDDGKTKLFSIQFARLLMN